jgi:type IV pilus assembly protein PilE
MAVTLAGIAAKDEYMTIRPAFTRTHARKSPHGVNGFTLIELLVAMLVMIILSSVAVASYRSFSEDARRTTAITALTDAASRQEQFFLDNKSYTKIVGGGGINVSTTVDGGYYTLGIVDPSAACPLTRCWVLQAVPQGTQANDNCGTLRYDSDGDRTPAGCW